MARKHFYLVPWHAETMEQMMIFLTFHAQLVYSHFLRLLPRRGLSVRKKQSEANYENDFENFLIANVVTLIILGATQKRFK